MKITGNWKKNPLTRKYRPLPVPVVADVRYHLTARKVDKSEPIAENGSKLSDLAVLVESARAHFESADVYSVVVIDGSGSVKLYANKNSPKEKWVNW